MADLSPQEIADKQIRRSIAAVSDYKRGVRNPRKSPMREAIKKKAKMLANVTEAIENGAWEAGLAEWTDEEWSEITENKGGKNYATGIEMARADIEKFQTAYKPIRDAAMRRVNEMPDDTFEERVAKSEAMQRALHDQPYKKGGRRRR